MQINHFATLTKQEHSYIIKYKDINSLEKNQMKLFLFMILLREKQNIEEFLYIIFSGALVNIPTNES